MTNPVDYTDETIYSETGKDKNEKQTAVKQLYVGRYQAGQSPAGRADGMQK